VVLGAGVGTLLGGESLTTALHSGGQTSWQLPHLVWSITFIPSAMELIAPTHTKKFRTQQFVYVLLDTTICWGVYYQQTPENSQGE